MRQWPRRPRSAAWWPLLAVLLAPAVAGQAPASPSPQTPVARFESRIDLVMLDVSVLDRDRRPVRGLAAADFTVYEDGVAQPISTFTAIDLPDVEVAPAAWVRDIASDVRRNDDLADRRIIAIVMDDALPMSMLAADQAIPHVKRVASEVVTQLGPRDLAAVVYPLDKRQGQDFTDDRARLLAAIDRWAPGMPDSPDDRAGFTAMRQQFLYRSLMSTIRMLTEYLAELPNRRKAIVLVSEGIPVDLEQLNPEVDLAAGVVPSGVLQVIADELRQTLAAAHRANVSIYPIDPAGLRTGRSLTVDFLRGLATDTGGYAVVDTNDTESGVRQILVENSSYYLIGYLTQNPRMEGRYRRISVRVNVPGATVRARNGYFEPDRPRSSKKPAKPVDPTWKTLASMLPTGDVAMQATATAFAVPGRREQAVAIVTALRQPLPAGTDRIIENVDMLVQAYDPGGSRRTGLRHKVRVVLRPDEVPQDVTYEVLSRIDLRPGRYQIRMAATSSMQGRSGSVFVDVDVPDVAKAALSLSGVLLSVSPGVTAVPKDAFAGLVPIVPTTERDFESDDRVEAFARLYQGGKKPVLPATVTTRVVDGRGNTVFEKSEDFAPDRFGTSRSVDYRLELPIAEFSSGSHLVSIEAIAGTASARRDVPFRVR